MAGEILTQPTGFQRDGAFTEIAVLYGEKAVREAQARLQVVLEFKSLKPKSVQFNGSRIPSPAVEGLTRKASVSLGTLWRCDGGDVLAPPANRCAGRGRILGPGGLVRLSGGELFQRGLGIQQGCHVHQGLDHPLRQCTDPWPILLVAYCML